jgi:hypothetical protein
MRDWVSLFSHSLLFLRLPSFVGKCSTLGGAVLSFLGGNITLLQVIIGRLKISYLHISWDTQLLGMCTHYQSFIPLGGFWPAHLRAYTEALAHAFHIVYLTCEFIANGKRCKTRSPCMN